ncbi:MAG: ABC transporter ATP-binding protein [Micrococcaceae bacterium]|nr:ABC transporter ATP-binding protein [Micrococcaceae bacterium]
MKHNANSTVLAMEEGSDSLALVARNIEVSFGHIRVIEGLNLEIARNRTVGLVGESGSGKSTLGKAIVGINRIRTGQIEVFGRDISRISRRERRDLSRVVQYIPQDPYSSLSPRRTIGQTLAEALDPQWARTTVDQDKVKETLHSVGLDMDVLPKFPHQFSGGQRQRIAIARTLLLEPQLIIADEVTSALDVSVQKEIIQLLKGLKQSLSLTMLFISHNLAVVEDLCDDVVVMQRGTIMERGSVTKVFQSPESPYTQSLLASVPGAPGFALE